jgi:hypothetical protein
MASQEKSGRIDAGKVVAACVVALLLLIPLGTQAQTVLHSFTNGADGGEPWAGLSMDRIQTRRISRIYMRTTSRKLNSRLTFRPGRSGVGTSIST